MYDNFGSLRVVAQTGGAYPVEGAVVRIRGADEFNKNVIYSILTDRDGSTPRLDMKTPNVALSFDKNSLTAPYSTYDLEITAEGYYPKRIYGIDVFPGVSSLQIISMIPMENNSDDYPIGELIADIPEYKGV